VQRPTVSDDLRTLKTQCLNYYQEPGIALNSIVSHSPTLKLEMFHKQTLGSEWLLLDGALIDSAFIVWDMRSRRCQSFNAHISCTWLDEIHCYSDRDQVSFPFIVAKMGLREVETIDDGSGIAIQSAPETHHRYFAQHSTSAVPMIHIAKSSCHWYFQGLDRCDFEQHDLAKMTKTATLLPFYLTFLLIVIILLGSTIINI